MSTNPVEEFSVGMPRNYLRPCLLLLLAEGTSHGYELLDQVTALGLDRADPGSLYRCLRAMDEEALVHSFWEPSTSGPARRTYALTDEGREWLHAIAGSLAEVSRALDAYHRRYQKLVEQDEHAR
ncbi:MAG: helix-turn-helix transcriptional regulator [Nocardioidaceae bacterium]|nr:helix-turn-helix transcriptional regulator [Nocardioidaceae bacterium]